VEVVVGVVAGAQVVLVLVQAQVVVVLAIGNREQYQ